MIKNKILSGLFKSLFFSLISLIFMILISATFIPLDYVKTGKTNYELSKTDKYDWIKTGDILFQSTNGGQSQAIKIVTNSIYTHCGIIYKLKGKYYVLEAIQPVSLTPLNDWIARGENEHFVVKRLKNDKTVLTNETLNKLIKTGRNYLGKNYDYLFEWTDNSLYCSELVWKTYQTASGLEIGKLQKIKEFDLTDELVKKIVKERYGDKIPLNETVITPVSIFNSELLITVNE